jgi:DNA-binding response OmpR family regulator
MTEDIAARCPTCGHALDGHHGISVDLEHNVAIIDGRAIALPAKMAELLHVLVEEMPRTVHRERIFDRLYGVTGDESPSTNVLQVYVHHLRRHLRGTRYWIETHWDNGYSLTCHG